MTEIQTSNPPVRQQYHAQKCPVCTGWGTVSNQRLLCHACEGLGYLKIPVETKNTEREKDEDEPSAK